MNYIIEDVIDEILKYLPYHVLRSVNNKYKILADNYELNYNCHKPITCNNFTFEHIITYLDREPILFSINNYDMSKFNITTFHSAYNSSEYQKIINKIWYLYNKIKGIYLIILNPKFYLFLLNNHPLYNNQNFIKSKLIVTIKYNLQYLKIILYS